MPRPAEPPGPPAAAPAPGAAWGRALRARPLRTVSGIAGSLAFLLLLLLWVGPRGLLRPWGDAPPEILLLAAAGLWLSYALRAVRIRRLVDTLPHREGRPDLAFGAALRVTLLHNGANHLLPARAGELAFPWLLRRHGGIGLATGAGVLVSFRTLDLVPVVAGLAACGPLLGLPVLPSSAAAVSVVALALGAGPLVTGLAQRPGAGLSGRLLAGLPPTVPAYYELLAWTLANWAAKLAAFVLALGAFRSADPGTLLGSVLAGDLSSLLPVHGVMGLGTYEAGAALPLVAAAVPPNEAIAAVAALHAFVLVQALVLAALAALFPGGSGAGTGPDP